jgi:hypothetical protein
MIQFSDVELSDLFIKKIHAQNYWKIKQNQRAEENWMERFKLVPKVRNNNFGNMAIIQEIYTDKLMVSWIIHLIRHLCCSSRKKASQYIILVPLIMF